MGALRRSEYNSEAACHITRLHLSREPIEYKVVQAAVFRVEEQQLLCVECILAFSIRYSQSDCKSALDACCRRKSVLKTD